MSIFSRLRKRGAEEGGAPESAPSAPAPKSPPAPAPAPPARAAEPAKPPAANAAESLRSSREAARPPAPPASPPPRGNVQSPTSGTIGAVPAPAPAAARPAAAAKPAASSPPPSSNAPPAAPPARAASPFPAPGITPPPPPAPIAVSGPGGGSLDTAIARALENSSVRRAAAFPEPPPPPPAPDPVPEPQPEHGASTESDEAALRATFEELAVAHVSPIRNAMMEVQFGEAQASWLELGRPALKSLRSMASEVGHSALVAALDGFVGALQSVLEPGQPTEVNGSSRESLLAAYAPLATCLPRAFALEGEHDRREPIIVRALLEQVAGLEPLMIDKLMAAGLGTLPQLFAARADELAAVSGIPDSIAAATAARIQAFRRATPATLAAVDTASTVRELTKLLEQLRAEHASFEEASRGWTPDARAAKKQLRERRQTTFLQITIALVRLGEIDFALRLPKLPFVRRIEDLDRVISARAAALPKRAERESAGDTAAA
jgi:hypothetical protein